MSFSPDGVQLSLPGGFSLDLMKYWDGQPIYFVCCARAPRNEAGTGQPLGKVFWCVGIEVLKDEEDDEHDRDREEYPSKPREESATGSSSGSSTGPSTPPPPPYEGDISPHVASSSDIETEDQAGDDGTLTDADPKSSEPTTHSKYYIKPGDTLLGISLRFGVDVSLSFTLS